MPVPAALLDMTVDPVVHEIDERWIMAYSAALGDHSDHTFDTTRADGVVAHPLFSVCPEWQAIVASRSMSERLGMTHAEVLTGVHATHDVTVHRLTRPGDRLTTHLAIVGITDISPGAKVTTRLTTLDQDDQPVATTTQDTIYLGVPTDRVDHADPSPPPPITGSDRRSHAVSVTVDLAAGTAHVYTECARIWNPIHTDRSVASRWPSGHHPARHGNPRPRRHHRRRSAGRRPTRSRPSHRGSIRCHGATSVDHHGQGVARRGDGRRQHDGSVRGLQRTR